jgi:hypothetical protein
MKLKNGIIQKRQPSVAASRSQTPPANLQLEGFWLYLARGAWIAFVLFALLMLPLILVATHGESYSICPFLGNCAVTPATAQALHHVSIAPSSFVIYNVVLALLQSLICLCVGGFIFWRKSNEPIALVACFFLVSIGLSPFLTLTTSPYPLKVIFISIYVLCIFTALGYFLMTFPDGHFVPRWSILLLVLWTLRTIFYLIPAPYAITMWPPALNAIDEIVSYGGTIVLMIYRYIRVLSPSQQQQAKWLLFGFGGMFVLIILYDLIAYLVPGAGAADSVFLLANGTIGTLTFLLLPLSMGIAILRFRLWEIDLIIRRTLIYTALSIILVLIYVGLVFIFGALLRNIVGQQQNPLVIVASTLVVAALVQPLRHGIQRVIDRRFYRRKYDATKTIEAFSATLRSEVDLSQLKEHLLNVVQDTMQPAHISLWLLRPEKEEKRESE